MDLQGAWRDGIAAYERCDNEDTNPSTIPAERYMAIQWRTGWLVAQSRKIQRDGRAIQSWVIASLGQADVLRPRMA